MLIDQEIQNVKKEVEALKISRIQSQTELTSLDKEKERLLEKCTLLNVNPKDVGTVLQQVRAELENEIILLKNELEKMKC